MTTRKCKINKTASLISILIQTTKGTKVLRYTSILQLASYEGAVKVTDVIKKETRSEVFFILSHILIFSPGV